MRHVLSTIIVLALGFFISWPAQAAGPKARTLTGPKGTVWAVAFSPDAKLVAAASDVSEKGVINGKDVTIIKGSELRIWDAQTGKLKKIIICDPQTRAVAFSSDAKLVATGAIKEVKLWDIATGEARQTLKDHLPFVKVLVFSADGKVLATLSSWKNKGEVRLYNAKSWKLLRILKDDTADLHCLALSGDGKTVVAANQSDFFQPGARSDIRIWDAQTGELKRTFAEPQSHVESVALSPDGKLMAAAPIQISIKLWDLQSGKAERTFDQFVTALAFLPDGQTLASRLNNEVKLIDLKTGKVEQTIKTGEHTWCWAFSGDGKTLATGSGEAGKGAVELWDISAGKK